MTRAQANGIELEYETLGDPADPTFLLVMGLGAQMILWDERFCRMLAERGYHVIRFDNRDCGLSTKIDATAEVPDVATLAANGTGSVNAAYTLSDMADDAAGLLDALGIAAAHCVGASLGGRIVLTLALEHPERVLSLCSISSGTGAPVTKLPSPDVLAALMEPTPPDRQGAIEASVRKARVLASTGFPFDEAAARAYATRAYDRDHGPEGRVRQMMAVAASPDLTERLASLDKPALVIHGGADPLAPLEGGEATAKAIPGALLETIPGMGHDLPEGAWADIIDALDANARRSLA